MRQDVNTATTSTWSTKFKMPSITSFYDANVTL